MERRERERPRWPGETRSAGTRRYSSMRCRGWRRSTSLGLRLTPRRTFLHTPQIHLWSEPVKTRALGLVLLLCFPATARAAVVLDLDLPEMTRRAARVVHGVVLGERVEIDADGRPVTEST